MLPLSRDRKHLPYLSGSSRFAVEVIKKDQNPHQTTEPVTSEAHCPGALSVTGWRGGVSIFHPYKRTIYGENQGIYYNQ